MSAPVAKPPKRPIPAFANWREEADFWDSHDLTDYFDFEHDQGLPRSDEPLSEQITLSIDRETMAEVRAAAAERGMPVDLLLFLWIVERRDAERARRANAAERAGGRDAAAPAR